MLILLFISGQDVGTWTFDIDVSAWIQCKDPGVKRPHHWIYHWISIVWRGGICLPFMSVHLSIINWVAPRQCLAAAARGTLLWVCQKSERA